MLKRAIKRAIRALGYDVSRFVPKASARVPDPEVMEPEFHDLRRLVAPYTMTSIERMYALYKAVEYIVVNKIPGSLVECGVWKGGSAMLMALTLRHFGSMDRQVFLYDTFRGMSAPTEADRSVLGECAPQTWPQTKTADGSSWCYASTQEVRDNLATTGYPDHLLHFVEGRVEDTLPSVVPERVALLRLDTDWYESTHHELEHLYPLISRGGVLLIDDYGYWQGAKQAVDAYFGRSMPRPLLVRLDTTGRLAVKTS